MNNILDNKLDQFFDKVLNKFYDFVIKTKINKKIIQDINFISFQSLITTEVMSFTDKKNQILQNTIGELFLKESNKKSSKLDKSDNYEKQKKILNEYIVKYCFFYIYTLISINYDAGRDLYTTNLIEIANNQKNNKLQIDNFFNSESNSKLIYFFNIIKNYQNINKLANTLEKFKVILQNNPIKFESLITYFETVGDDFILKSILIKENSHNFVKSLIMNQVYLNDDKEQILKLIKDNEVLSNNQKYIDIVVSKESKLIDFILLQKYLTLKQINDGLAEEIYTYLEEIRNKKIINVKTNSKIVNFLLTEEILIPITEEFLRYHKDTEKYTYSSMLEDRSRVSEREDTKIKFILTKLEKIENYYSEFYKQNLDQKSNVEKLFFTQMFDRFVSAYNDNEELKIIQKLEDSEKTSDIDMLTELENFRKYAFLNFKDFSKDGFKFRPSKTVKCIRYSSILMKEKGKNFNNKIEFRNGNDNLDINLVGVAFNPLKINLEKFFIKDLQNVNENNDDGIENLISKVSDFFPITKSKINMDKDGKLFYFLFDIEKENSKFKSYVNIDSLTIEDKIMITLKDLFNHLETLIKQSFENMYKSNKISDKTNSFQFENILKLFQNKNIYNFDFNPILKDFLEGIFYSRIKEIKVTEDYVDSLIPGKSGNIISLPEIKKDDIKKGYYDPKDSRDFTLITDRIEEDISIEEEKVKPICFHHYRLAEIRKLSKLGKVDEYSQDMFDFMKQYVKLNNKNDFICKSCEENLFFPNFRAEYDAEKDQLMTTSLFVKEDLDKLPKYSKLRRSIKNIEKTLEKTCSTINLLSYLGGDNIPRVNRKAFVRDIIDLILIHTEYLRNQPKDRIQIAQEKYGIKHSSLFFFKLEDDIFLTSSTDIDKFKQIKYNNVLTYLILLLIADINHGQLEGLKTDKRCNYFLFTNFKDNIFKGIKIITRDDKVEDILNYPLFCYIIYYFSCVFTSSYLWLWDYSNDKGFNQTIQMIIINTVIDLYNSLMEANFYQEKKNILYEVIYFRLIDKLKKVYSDNQLLEKINNMFMKNIKKDKETNKILFVSKKVPMISIGEKIEKIYGLSEFSYSDLCDTSKLKLPISEPRKIKTEIPTLLTNCSNGQFHNWKFSSNQIVCSKCDVKLKDVIGKISSKNKKSDNYDSNKLIESYKKITDQIKLNNLSKLVKEHCLTGEFHEFSKEGNVCSKCGINPETFKYSKSDYLKLAENLKRIKNNEHLKTIDEIKKYNDILIKNISKRNDIINKFESRYQKFTNFNLENYIDTFIDRLTKIVGKTVKMGTGEIYLNSNYYLIDHDSFGNSIKNPLIIFDKNSINLEENNYHFKKDVYTFKDNRKNLKIYYDAINLNYLGYSEKNSSKINEIKSLSKLNIVYSIRDKLKKLGLPDDYFNLNLISKEEDQSALENLLKNDKKENFKGKFDLKSKMIKDMLKLKSNNLRQNILKFIRIIFNVRNRNKNKSIYNQKENRIINETINNIKKFRIRNTDGQQTIFKHWNYISNLQIDEKSINNIFKLQSNKQMENFKLKENLGFKFFRSDILNQLNNLDSKLLFFLIFNLNRLLDHNNESRQNNQILTILIIRLISYCFENNKNNLDEFQVRKFYKIVNLNNPYIDESLRVVGSYEELLNSQEIDDENRGIVKNKDKENEKKIDEEKEQLIDAQEETDAVDIDDYDEDDSGWIDQD